MQRIVFTENKREHFSKDIFKPVAVQVSGELMIQAFFYGYVCELIFLSWIFGQLYNS